MKIIFERFYEITMYYSNNYAVSFFIASLPPVQLYRVLLRALVRDNVIFLKEPLNILVFCVYKMLESKNCPVLSCTLSRILWILKKLIYFLQARDINFLKVSIKFVTMLILFYVLVFWPRGMRDLSSLTRV